MSYIRVFGCAAYAHQVEGKLDPRATNCVMLGYSEGVKGYRLWVLGVKGIKIINSRDVKFNELDMPCLKNLVSQNKQTEEGESSTGKKMEFEAKRLGDNLEDSEIQPQEESDQEAVIE